MIIIKITKYTDNWYNCGLYRKMVKAFHLKRVECLNKIQCIIFGIINFRRHKENNCHLLLQSLVEYAIFCSVGSSPCRIMVVFQTPNWFPSTFYFDVLFSAVLMACLIAFY